jgi:hypothetical protein
VADDNEVMRGLYNLSNVQDRLRIYAQDKDFFRFWVLRQINTISILKIISEKFGSVPAENIRDWEFRYPEFDELPYAFFPAEDSNVTHASNTKIKIKNKDAVILNQSTRILCSDIYCKGVVADATTDMATDYDVANGITLREEMRVMSVGSADSAGVGFRLVTLRRAHPADSYTNTAPPITTTMKLIVNNLVSRADDFPKAPVTKNSKMLENYIQITRQSYGLGEHMVQGGGIDTFLAKGGSEYLNIQYQLAETFMLKAIERGLLTGRKAKKEIDGSLEYESGGINEFIMRDKDHYMDLKGKAITVELINNFVRRMADVSGVKELWLFTGTHMSEQIANAYENKSIYYTNASLSVQYMMKIKTLESVGRDLVVHHVTAPIMNELGGANEAMVLNLTEYNYNQKHKFGCFQVAHKVPFHDAPENEPSFKSNEGYKGKWRELYGAWGLVRRLPETHFYWHNAAAVSN